MNLLTPTRGDIKMNPLNESWHIHVDITQYCFDNCLYCSRYNRHQRQDHKYHMPLAMFEDALHSLRFFPNRIGLMGGEPTLHPQFDKICEILQKEPYRPEHGKYNGYRRYSLFTAGGKKYEQYKASGLLGRTFEYVAINEHKSTQKAVCRHQPTTIAIGEAVANKNLRDRLIDDCWAQKTWCPNITPKGAFFCELASAIDRVIDGPGGWKLTDDWWNKTPDQYKDQVDRYCHLCGFPVPIERELMNSPKERFSPKLLQLFRDHNLPKCEDDDVDIVRVPFTEKEINETAKTWRPGEFRQDLGEGC